MDVMAAATNLVAQGWWHDGGWGGGPWWPAWIAWTVLFWGAVIVGGVYLFRHRGTGGRGRGSAEDLLEQRYARGEIDDEEFYTRLSVLRDRPR